MAEYFSGRVHSIVFENSAQDFYILRMVLDAQEETTLSAFSSGPTNNQTAVRGNVPGMPLKIGSWFGFEAKWERHTKFGPQLVILKAPVVKGGWTPETALAMLVSHGVGERICHRLRDHFGEDLVLVLNRGNEEEMRQVQGITPFAAAHLVSKWAMIRAYFRTLDFLADAQVPRHKISQIWTTFGSDAQEILSANPWALVEIEGIKFEQCDEVALKLGLDMGSALRVRGAVLHVCKSGRGMGHLFMSSGELLSETRNFIPNVSAPDVAQALADLHREEIIHIDRTTRRGTTAIYEPWLRHLESQCASLLFLRVSSADPKKAREPEVTSRTTQDKLTQALAATAFKPYAESLSAMGVLATEAFQKDPEDLVAVAEAALVDWSLGSKIELSEKQLKGALNALVSPVSILTGLPGTGKTTTLRAVVAVLKDANISFLLCAPTGIAAKRMSSLTGAPASTIHRAFKAQGWDKGGGRTTTYSGIVGKSAGEESSDGSGEDWEYGPDNPHHAQVVICDEFSMVDQHLLYRLLSCTSPRARLVCVGDAAQLPSVGPGNVLRDLISTDLFPTVSLTEIFRQEETSDIVVAAHSTFKGEVPECGTRKGSDFVLIEARDEDDILEITTRLVERLYAKRENFQVLSPRHAGTLGVTNLNQRLRGILNPKTPGLQEMRLGSEVLREDDRMMVVKNNYKLGIYNGDVGKVVRIDRKAREIEIKLHGPPVLHVRIPFKEASGHLRLAYCVTVHKCVHPDTLVETHNGLIPIRDASPQGNIATPEGERVYQGKVNNPEGPAIRITTRGGYSLTATPDHGIDVWDGERYVRREVGEIRKGDLLRLRLGVTTDLVVPSLLPGPSPHEVRAKVHHLPLMMDPTVAEFLGLMVADGTVSPKGFRLAKRHEDTADRFATLCRLLFRVEPKRYFKLGAHHVEVNSTFLSTWLLSIGGLSPNAKAAPECILRSSSENQARFLRGLFADGSVNLTGGCLDHIEWSCKPEGLPNVVRTMLLRFGIPCGTTQNRSVHTIYIYGAYAQRFGEIIGFPSEAKRSPLLLRYGNQTKYFVPISKEEARELRREHLNILGASACGNVVQRGRLSLHKLKILADAGADTKVVRTLLERTLYHHEPVVSLEETICPSMCVEVSEGHRFLQNGFSAWNSQGQEFDVIVMPLVKGFAHQLQRNLFYTAITRAKKKVFLLGHREALVRSVLNNREDIRNTLFPDRLRLEFQEGSLVSDKE